jgi:hypothetical protein
MTTAHTPLKAPVDVGCPNKRVVGGKAALQLQQPGVPEVQSHVTSNTTIQSHVTSKAG